MNNPIFNFIEPHMHIDQIYENMGFDVLSVCEEVPDSKLDDYSQDPFKYLDNWKIEPPEGYVIAWKSDSEDGPIALLVKPKSHFAKALLDFGFSDVAQEASRLDYEIFMSNLRIKINNIRTKKGKNPPYPELGFETVNYKQRPLNDATKLKVFHNDCDWVVAHSKDDASQVIFEYTGGDYGDDPDSWSECDPSEKLKVYYHELPNRDYYTSKNFDISQDGKSGQFVISGTIQQWIDCEGRGFLCSTEY